MAAEDECLCCRGWDLAEATVLELEITTEDDEEICLTARPDFQLHIEPVVLRTLFRMPRVNWKRNEKPKGPSRITERSTSSVYQLRVMWRFPKRKTGQN